MKFLRKTCSFFLLFFLLSFLAEAKNCPPVCGSQINNKKEKKFDFDKNGFLDLYERSLMYTQARWGWKIADREAKKKFDYDEDHLLNPQEWEHYENRKKRRENLLDVNQERSAEAQKRREKYLQK